MENKTEILVQYFIASGLTENEARKRLKDKAFWGTFKLVVIDTLNNLIAQAE